MSVSWGDVSTAFYTTGIENITVYWPANDAMIRQFKFSRLLHPLLRLRSVQNFIKGRIEKKVEGPNRQKRDQQQVHVWGEARNATGENYQCADRHGQRLHGYSVGTGRDCRTLTPASGSCREHDACHIDGKGFREPTGRQQ